MMDLIQILLTIVIIVLTILLAIIGAAVYQILREFKKSIEKINLILDDTSRITAAVAQPVEDASQFIHGLRGGINFLASIGRFFKEKNKRKNQEINNENLIVDKQETKEISSKPAKNKRFFRKAGKPLKKKS